MAINDLVFKSGRELSALIKKKTVSPVEAADACLDRIESLNPRLNAFITVLRDNAIERARQAETEIQKGRYLGPLHGIPYAAKDIFATKGIRTTNGSKATADWVPTYESTATDRLNRAGAILVGKLNLAEFAYGGDAVTSGFGPPRNPWHTEYSAAGSSNGSAVALSANMVPFALGTDTGGSIRYPASFCGIAGFKPTYGRVSRFGVTTLSWTLDHAGPMARTVEDIAMLLQVIAGHDERDNTSASDPVPDYSNGLGGSIKGLRIGVLQSYVDSSNTEVRAAFQAAIEKLTFLGGKVLNVEVPHLAYVRPVAAKISVCEGACFHERRLREKLDLIDPVVTERLVPAKFYTATDYIKAQRVRTLIIDETADVFRKCDLIACPTMSVLPYKLDMSGADARAPRGMPFTSLGSLTGIPAISIPCGMSAGPPTMPIGMMLHARPFDEGTVLRVAYAYAQATDWHKRRPPVI